jgi:ABC-type transport system involved in multi-copper enzyme maturation permease subunit
MDRLRELIELPLFVRELTESANRKRTYALRVLTALIVIMVFGVVYFEMTWEQTTVYRMLGSGNSMAVAVLITNIIAIFVLLPAMSCSAIALEREKQTLSLLLISGLTPGTIVIEKWLSRMTPILVMLIASSPVLGIAYVCGGFGTEQLLLMIIVMLIATIQVASTAIFCSSFARSAVSAFWWTYIVLAFVIFAPILVQESGFFPEIPFRFLSSGPSEQLGFAFVVYLVSIESFMYRAFDVTEVFWCAIPPLSMAICMLIASRFALVRVGTGEGLSFALQLRNLKSTVITKFKQLIKGSFQISPAMRIHETRSRNGFIDHQGL